VFQQEPKARGDNS